MASVKAPPWERLCAALVLALPLVYLLTDRSTEIALWRWSGGLLVLIAFYFAFYAVWMASYLSELPRLFARARRGVVVMATTLVVLALAAELGLALVDRPTYAAKDNRGRHAPDPVVGHVYLPNWSGVLQTREFRAEWRSNAQGLRAERDVGPKRAGVLRVLAVGDSFTVGDQVALEDTWPAVAEACLADSLGPDRVEVFNAGFPGYGTVNEARWIERFAGALEPDLIVLAMTPNDLSENPFPLQYTAVGGALASADFDAAAEARFEERSRWWSLPGRVERSHVLRVLDPLGRYRRWRWGTSVPHEQAYALVRSPEGLQRFELFERHLREARDAARAIGAEFAAIVIPFRIQIEEMRPGLEPGAFGRHWVEFGAAEGFPVLDLLPAFRAAPDPRGLYLQEDAHCNAAGYGLIGTQTCGFLLERVELLSAAR